MEAVASERDAVADGDASASREAQGTAGHTPRAPREGSATMLIWTFGRLMTCRGSVEAIRVAGA